MFLYYSFVQQSVFMGYSHQIYVASVNRILGEHKLDFLYLKHAPVYVMASSWRYFKAVNKKRTTNYTRERSKTSSSTIMSRC